MNNSFSKVPLQTARKFCPTASECIKAEDGMCKFWDVMHHYECEIHLEHERIKFRNQVKNARKLHKQA